MPDAIPSVPACAGCLSRRAFLARGSFALAGAAAVAAGCGDGQFGPTAVTPPKAAFSFKVSTLPDLAVMGQLAVPPGNPTIAVKRTGPGSFDALSIVCTHQGCLTRLEANALLCPCHDAQYDANGTVTQQPRNVSGTATALPRLPTLYDPVTDTLTVG